MQQRVLIIVAKQPAAGQTKTRLCPPLDGATAAALYGCLLRDSLDLARRTTGARHVIGYAPAEAAGFFAALAPDMGLYPQRGADLGERLAQLLDDAFAQGATQAVVMSSDSPSLPAAYLKQAFAALDSHDAVLGPTEDGGYYLLGLTRPQPRLLREVRMSTPSVARDTLALAAALGLRTALLPPWYDIDTSADLARLARELRAAPPEICPATRAFLASLDVVK